MKIPKFDLSENYPNTLVLINAILILALLIFIFSK